MSQRDAKVMFMKTLTRIAFAAALGLGAPGAWAAGGGGEVTDYAFPFEGPFGSYDEAQLQRGLQVYTMVCSGCHGMTYVSFRSLGDLGYTDAEVRAYAEQYSVPDETTDDPGDMRAAKPTDQFPESSYPGAPDMSLIAKARAGFHGPLGTGISQLINGMGGPEYIASLLTGYTGGTREEAGTLLYENPVMDGGWLSMPQPLYGDDVVYEDGTEATIEQQSKDVSAFLMWAAEPKLEQRKTTGLTAVMFLGILTVLLYLTNKKLWYPHKHPRREKPAE